MAIETTTITRDEERSSVLAGEPLNLRNKRDRSKLTNALMRDRILGQSAWNHYERLGEVHFALGRAARIAGYTKLHAVRYSDDRSVIESTVDNGPAPDIVRSIYSRTGGLRGLMERYFVHMKVPAESHLIRDYDGEGNGKTPDGYQFVSSKELDDKTDPLSGLQLERRGRESGLKWVTMPGVGGVPAFEKNVAQADYLGRVWAPSGQYIDVPESPLNALDTQCTLLDEMTQSMRATMRSRFATAGFLYFSDKIANALGGKHKKAPNDNIIDIIYKIMKENTEASQDAMSVIPILMMGSAEVGKVMEHITIDRSILETDLKLRAELIDRILFGLDINVQATKGNTDVNHFGAWASSADELRLAVIPDVEAACWVFNRFILFPQLRETKMDTADIMRLGIWYDLSEAAVKVNREEAARQLHDRGGLNTVKLAESAGYTAADVIEGVEYIRWLGVKFKDTYLATFGMPEQIDLDFTMISPNVGGRPEENPGDEPLEGPGVGNPGSPDPSDSESDIPKSQKPA
jgi:hypothetical protein